MDTPTKPKRRQLPHVWKRFWSLGPTEEFFLGSRIMLRASFPDGLVGGCFASRVPLINLEFIWPWTRVRTTQLVRDSLPGWAGLALESSVMLSEDIRAALTKTSPFLTMLERHHESRRVPQPHSDNNITGPTS